MRTTPRSYLNVFVEPNLNDYLQLDRGDARLGFNAAISAFQLADIFYNFYKRQDPSVLERWSKMKDLLVHLGQIEPHFLTVQSVATVYKHLYARGGFYEVGSPGALWRVTIAGEQVQIESDFARAGQAM